MEQALFINKVRKNITKPFFFEFCGISQTSPSHVYGPGIRKMHIIHLVLEGRGSYYVNNKGYFLKKGDVFLIKPNETVYYVSDSVEPWTYAWIAFSGEDVPFLLSQTSFSENHYSFASNRIDDYLKIISDCLQIKSEFLIDELRLFKKLYQFFEILLEDGGKSHSITLSEVSSLTIQTMEYIEKNSHSRLRVGEIADQLKVDRSYLSRVFKCEMNLSLKKWLNCIEMNKACHLLISTDSSISEIAEKLGFQSIPSFTNAFTKYTHLSPKDFRKLQKNSPSEYLRNQEIWDALQNQELVGRAT